MSTALFGAHLRVAMRNREMTSRRLAEALGVTPTAVAAWRSGKTYPRLKYAVALAEHLHADMLAEYARVGRTRPCEVCGAPFVDDSHGGSQRLYCNPKCKHAGVWRRRKAEVAISGAVAKHRLRDMQTAVNAFCLQCEPMGLCRWAECPLRSVSPLRLESRASA